MAIECDKTGAKGAPGRQFVTLDKHHVNVIRLKPHVSRQGESGLPAVIPPNVF